MMKIAVVTGASSGMGREFVGQIAEKYPWLDEIKGLCGQLFQGSEPGAETAEDSGHRSVPRPCGYPISGKNGRERPDARL